MYSASVTTCYDRHDFYEDQAFFSLLSNLPVLHSLILCYSISSYSGRPFRLFRLPFLLYSGISFARENLLGDLN